MSQGPAYAKLRSLGVRVLRTREAAAVLGVSPVTGAQTLRRMVAAGLVQPLRHGLVWIGDESVDAALVLEHVSAPYPAYSSLYSALYLRGVLSQLPELHYAVTLGRAQRVRTSVGTFSLHRVAPALFGGFETLASGARLATTEKALFDLAYLAPTRSRLFARPPELELPARLDRPELRTWVGRIAASRRRVQTLDQLNALLRGGGRAALSPARGR